MPENRRRFRNPVAQSPLMRKGGPHQRSRSGERRDQLQALEAELDSWWEENDELDWSSKEPVPKGTDSSPLYMLRTHFMHKEKKTLLIQHR